MKLIALDTATEACSAALLIDGQVTLEYEELGRGHAERILPMIDSLLGGAKLTLRELDAIAFGRGPGGFTGVRLATSLAQGLAFSSGRPLVPVSDLRAIARLALDEHPSAERVLICSDARMGEVYWGCFERRAAGTASGSSPEDGGAGSFAQSGIVEPVDIERVSAPEAVRLPDTWQQVDVLAGRGVALYANVLRAIPRGAEMNRLLPHAGAVARLAATDFARGAGVKARDAAPVYLRDQVVQIPAARGAGK